MEVKYASTFSRSHLSHSPSFSFTLSLSLSLSLRYPYPMYTHVRNLLGDDYLSMSMRWWEGRAPEFHRQREGAAYASGLSFVLRLSSEVLRELATQSRS